MCRTIPLTSHLAYNIERREEGAQQLNVQFVRTILSTIVGRQMLLVGMCCRWLYIAGRYNPDHVLGHLLCFRPNYLVRIILAPPFPLQCCRFANFPYRIFLETTLIKWIGVGVKQVILSCMSRGNHKRRTSNGVSRTFGLYSYRLYQPIKQLGIVV